LISVSDDPTRPVPSGWPDQPPPYSPPGGRRPQDPHGPGDRDDYSGGQAGRGRHSGGYQDNRGGYQNDQGGYRGDRGRDNRGNYAGDWGRTPQPPARPEQATDWSGWEADDGGRPRKRHRGLKILAIVVVILLVLAVIIDRVAVKLAENEVANQIKSAGFPVKPSVSIAGFPFLTQVAEKNFHQIDISASNVPEGKLEIASVKATMHGVHVNSSFSGATVDQTNGTALVTFAGLSNASGLGDGLKLSNAGHNELKATLSIGPISTDALAEVARTSPHQIQLKIVSTGGDLPLSALGNNQEFTFSMPNLPAGMTIQGVSVTGAGVQISISGTHTTFSQ
ncbi:MAG TPA: LmeA family phospholipid-binding protein, partial [Streptosporangiaceae bacterium]|nr:LmeA family phospholipid-binding protein [Streptosporangiaceae bacterium]